jgi:hypothetical protein
VADKVDILESDGFYTNADFLVKFAIKKVDGTVQPITNWALSWLMKVRTKDTDVSAVITKTTGTGITITDGPNGLCQVAIADSDTLSLREGVYVHELKRTDEGFETPLCAGKAVLKASVHRT